ncbi:MAG: TIGR04255 family protein [Oscillospiraceae bacterium]|nr:TIGR04255 family protein [Oscillospiraceae bacterium]
MFSNEKRCVYGKNQILEAVCQFRFPAILQIETGVPAEFQDAIRAVFPRYESRREQPPPKVTALPGQPPKVEQLPAVTNHAFLTADGSWRINLAQGFIALTSQRYTRWEEFAKMLDAPLAAFIRIYKPAYFERVGLRYINAFSRSALDLEEHPWRDLIEDRYLGLLTDELIPEGSFARCTQDTELALPGGCRLKLHAGPGMVRRAGQPENNEQHFMLDLDVSMSGNVQVSMAAGAMSTLHLHADSVFRDAITDQLHDAMQPEEV